MNSTRDRTIREALIAMGYKEVKPKNWMKPIGYQLFSYNEEKNEWVNWFKDGNDKIAIWETKSFRRDVDTLHQIKEWETWTKTDMWIHGNSDFHLAAIDIE